MDLVGGYGRGLYDGVCKYASMTRRWELWLLPSTIWHDSEKAWDWQVDGAIIFGLWKPSVFAALKNGVPMVNLTAVSPSYPVATVDVDHHAVGNLAAEYFIERGFKHVGFVGWPQSAHSTQREAGFRKSIADRASMRTFVEQWDGQRPTFPEPGLVEWLRDLPKPCGVFCANDERASQVMDACDAAKLAIPEQVAILGVDNDEIVYKRISTTLSTIELPAVRIGYEAAALLDRLIDGRKPKPMPTFQPLGVITRQSTGTSSVRDAEIAQAIQYIRAHAAEPIGIPDIAANAAISKRSLEQRFRKACGLSPVQFLTRARIDLAKRLLVETDLKMPVIAKRSGFSDASHLGVVFRRQTGLTLTAFRNQSRIVS